LLTRREGGSCQGSLWDKGLLFPDAGRECQVTRRLKEKSGGVLTMYVKDHSKVEKKALIREGNESFIMKKWFGRRENAKGETGGGEGGRHLKKKTPLNLKESY